MKKIVLISQQGSGTNLLRSFLNSHPDIYIADEIFTKSEKFRWYKENNKNSVKDYLEEFFNAGYNFDKQHIGYQVGDKPKVFGFDLKYNNINDSLKILDWLAKENPKIIHLYRCKGRTFLRGMNEINQATLTWQQFQNHKEFVNKWEDKIFKVFGDRKYMRLNYEDMTRGYEIESLPYDFEVELLTFLEVEPCGYPLKINDKGIREGKLKMRY